MRLFLSGSERLIMKKLCAGLLIFVVAAGVQAKGPKLILGEKEGLPVECEVCGYDVEKGLVKLRAGTKRGSKPFESFSTNVQDRIVMWATDEAFESSGLKVSIREEVDKKKVESKVGDYEYTGRSEEVTYVVVMENRSPFPMENVKVEYRIFYEGVADEDYDSSFGNVRSSNDNRAENKNVIYEKEYLDIPANDIVEFKTTSVRILNVNGERESTGQFSVRRIQMYEEDLLGIQFSVRRKGMDDHVFARVEEDGSVPKESKWGEYKEGNPERKPTL